MVVFLAVRLPAARQKPLSDYLCKSLRTSNRLNRFSAAKKNRFGNDATHASRQFGGVAFTNGVLIQLRGVHKDIHTASSAIAHGPECQASSGGMHCTTTGGLREDAHHEKRPP